MKIFCIGYNKTGTTSLNRFMEKNNIPTAHNADFGSNLEFYHNHNYSFFTDLINKYHNEFIFFSDVPFSLPLLYIALDRSYPGSKFILTVRDNENEWYESQQRFYKRMFPNGAPEWVIKIMTQTYKAPKDDIYNEKILKNSYLNHIRDVGNYFRGSNNLIKINLKDSNVVEKLENFIGIKFEDKVVPHLNRTK